jgi:hypothetical protein
MFTSPTFTGTVAGVTATHVSLGNVTNESKATMFTSPTFTGTVAGVTATHVGLGSSDDVTFNAITGSGIEITGVTNYNGLTIKAGGAARPGINFENVNQGQLGGIFGTEANSLGLSTQGGIEHRIRNANGASGDHLFKSFGTTILKLDGATNASTFKGNICLYSESTSTATAEIDKIEFKKSHPSGPATGYYTLGEIRSKTFGGYSGGLNFYTGRATTPGSYASTFAMTIDNKGQVGIGVETLPTDIYVASGGGYATLGIGQSSFLTAYKSDDSIELCQNTYLNTAGANRGITASVAGARLTLVDGQFVFATLQTASDKVQTAQNVLNINTAGNVSISSADDDQVSKEQTLTVVKQLGNNGVAIPVAFVDHTHSVDVTVIVKQAGASHVSSARGHSVAAYGVASTGVSQTVGSGNIQSTALAYLNTNGAGQDYVLTITPTFNAGSPPIAYITIRGNSTSVIAEY